MKSYVVHLKNQFPGGRVESSENHVDAYDADGNLRVSVRKTGAGQIIDAGHDTGATDAFCLSPIPKNARVFKLFPDGRVGLSEESQARKAVAAEIAVEGKVLSIEAYKKAGVSFDHDGNFIIPAKAPAPVEPAQDQNQQVEA